MQLLVKKKKSSRIKQLECMYKCRKTWNFYIIIRAYRLDEIN